ncbi:hypothetical protein ACOME3_000761 [Neoechinorhynchus agilis]
MTSKNDPRIGLSRRICFPFKIEARVVGLFVQKNSFVRQNDIVLTFRQLNPDGSPMDTRRQLRSPGKGLVHELYVRRGEDIRHRTPILVLKSCLHRIILHTTCSDCGEIVNDSESTCRLSMVHEMPSIQITREEGLRISESEMVRLENEKRLILVVDLDQTIVDSTCRRGRFNRFTNDRLTHLFRIDGDHNTYCSRFRNGVHEFFENIRHLYRMDVFTLGQRSYAREIVRFIDPNETLFSGRIVTRDECVDLSDKTLNLKSIYPSGDHMVVIIDDRFDVWNHADNQVVVKAFSYFRNSPLRQVFDTYMRLIGYRPRPNVTVEQAVVNDLVESIETLIDQDDSDYLKDLERILIRIHARYFSTEPRTTVHEVMDMERSKILQNVRIFLTGVVKSGDLDALEQCSISYYTRKLGATITSDFEDPLITHCIVGRRNTRKAKIAKRTRTYELVTPSWLWDCFVYWKRMPEDRYRPRISYNFKKSCPYLYDIRASELDDMDLSSIESDNECIDHQIAQGAVKRRFEVHGEHNNYNEDATSSFEVKEKLERNAECVHE